MKQKPANDPNVSAALSATPVTPVAPVAAVEPVVAPVVAAVATPVEPVVAPVTPVVAPVAVVEPVVAPVEPVVAPVEPVPVKKKYAEGNAFVNSAAEMLAAAGLNATDIFSRLDATEGVVSPEIRAEIEAKLGAATTEVLMTGYAQEQVRSTNARAEADAFIYEKAGGKEAWDKLAAWTATPESGLSAEAADSYNKMLAQGGVQAELAVNSLKEAFMQSPGFTQSANLLDGDGTPAVNTEIKAISRSEYIAEKQKAFNSNDGVAVASLEARARHTMQNLPDQWKGVRIQG